MWQDSAESGDDSIYNNIMSRPTTKTILFVIFTGRTKKFNFFRTFQREDFFWH